MQQTEDEVFEHMAIFSYQMMNCLKRGGAGEWQQLVQQRQQSVRRLNAGKGGTREVPDHHRPQDSRPPLPELFHSAAC